jgi:TolB-like protein/DNA-binding winged helix-turn-helix (wHTH) protein/Tfp pilus assembly protein PilF
MQERSSRVRFESFELDPGSGELRKGGLRLRIEDQPFRLLTALVQRPGEVLTREELRTALWPDDTYVDFERSLTRAMNKVRTALGDSAANPRFVETLPRRGYRFLAPVSQVDDAGPSFLPAPQRDDAGEPVATGRSKGRTRPWWWAAIAACILIAATGLILRRSWPARISGVAVLPFENVSGGPEQSYFGDGMTDQLIATLSRIRSLRVVSQESVMHYKNTRKKLSDIAADLNVNAIVEGSVAQSGGRLRIIARLVRFPGERAVWTKTYERNAGDILALQSELARNVATEIGALVTPEEEKRLAGGAHTVDPELHDLYLKGRFFVNEPSRDRIERGIQALEKVLRKDPGHAGAWAALADDWFNLSSMYLPPVEAMPKAKSAARKAIELDPESDAAHAVLGRIHLFYDWDWEAARERLQKALDLNPNSSAAWRGMGFLEMAAGRQDESLQAIDRALQMDPMFLWGHFQYVLTLTCARRHDAAAREARRALEWEPEFGWMRSILGMLHVEKGEFPQAIQELERSVQSQRAPTTLALLAQGYARSNRKAGAERILSQLVALASRQYVCPFEVAEAFATLGRENEAIQWMSKAVVDRVYCMIWLRALPWLDPIRSDTRYPALVRQVGFP